ncbi:hypothetical protein DL98DRAFT_585462 [Cadophora sp. DSE1049]|nr:hypothetical protein DL98DRAFT_585462 [Cadophora sp. DSE1049]
MGAFFSQESIEDWFSGLPAELIGNIISLLPPSDVANLRLTSKAFAVLGRKGLFNGRLTLRIYRDDMRRLIGIGSCPWLAACIQEIEIFVGEVDFHCFDHGFKGDIDDDALAQLQCIWRFLEVDRSRLFCKASLLATAFPSFTNVKSIVVTSTKFPFDFITHGESLRQTWHHMLKVTDDSYHLQNSRHRHEESAARFSSMVLAARAFLPPLTKLILDPFPIETLIRTDLISKEGEKTSMIAELIKVCKPLEYLQISIDGNGCDGVYDGPSVGRAMSNFLASLQHVRILELSFPVASLTTPSYIKPMLEAYLPCLRNFRLEKIRAPLDVLLPFLLRHKATLRELRLSSTALCISRDDSPNLFKDFVTALRDSFRLETFELFDWDPNEELLYVEERCQDPGEMSTRLEQYVKGEGPWLSGAESAFSNANIVKNSLEEPPARVLVFELDRD